MSDIRYAWRSLLHARWFTFAAIVTFALGIGVNVAVFSLVDRLLFRPLPYDRPSELVVIAPSTSGKLYMRLPKPLLVEASVGTGVFAGVAVAGQSRSYAFDPAAPDAEPVRLTEATYRILEVLGVRPVVGRGFRREDARAKARVGLLTYESWQRRLGGASDVVGRRLGVGESSVEIIGVLPQQFTPPSMFLAASSNGLVLDPDMLETATPRDGVWPAVARLRQGTSIRAAQAAMDAVAAHVSPLVVRAGDRPLEVLVAPLQATMFGRFQTTLWLVISAAAMVLLIACANLSSLFLARGRGREHTVALCRALGASSVRLMTLAFFECLVVAITGATAALCALAISARALVVLEPAELRQYAVNVTDTRVLVTAFIAVLICSVIASVLPTARLAQVDVQAVLQRGTKTGRRTRSVAARSLLAAEAAFGMLLVAGAILTGRSLIGLLDRDLGFLPRDLFVVSANLPWDDPVASKMTMYAQALEILRQQPGVESAGGVDTFSIGGNTFMRSFPSPERTSEGGLYQVTAGYFEALRTRVIAGRTLTDDDAARHAPVAVVSERGARVLWPGVPPHEVIGHMLKVANEPDRAVVGVVADQRATALRDPVAGAFVPYGQADAKLAQRIVSMDIVVRMRAGEHPDLAALRLRLRASYPQVEVSGQDTASLLDPSIRQPKFQALLFGSFAASGLLLAVIGLYAVASYDVTLRRYEMGVRMTLGASPSRLHWEVVRASLGPVAGGVLLGLIGTWWAGQYVQTLLEDVRAHDPILVGGAAATLIGAAALAAWAPARRAARTDPAVVLRSQ